MRPTVFALPRRSPVRLPGNSKSFVPTVSTGKPIWISKRPNSPAPRPDRSRSEGGSVDLILSDWLWVARERALGDDLVFYPYSSTLGAVMVPANSPIEDVADLKGKKLGVAGGPLDKSWLLLQALARRSGLDLKKQSDIVYGAPPLLIGKGFAGRNRRHADILEFLCRLEAKGMRRAVDMADVMKRLGASGPVAMIGYVFHGGWAAAATAALLDRFFSRDR